MATKSPSPTRRSPMEHPRHQYPQETAALQRIALSFGLVERIKWGKPCFTLPAADTSGSAGTNVLLLQRFNAYLALLFFQGALLDDPHHLLSRVGENTQAARQLRFTSPDEIAAREPAIRGFITQAIALAHAGAKTPRKPPAAFPVPDELHAALQSDPALRHAFAALTPGRQKGYLLQIAAAKLPATRTARVAKFLPRILAGKGLDD